MRIIYLSIGFISLALAIVGVALPLLPTTAEIATKAKTGDDKTAKAELSEKTAEKAG